MKPPKKNSKTESIELVRAVTMKIELPQQIQIVDIRKLAHDITSASNAFGFLIEQISEELQPNQNDDAVTKLNQLKAHQQLLKNLVDNICHSLLTSKK